MDPNPKFASCYGWTLAYAPTAKPAVAVVAAVIPLVVQVAFPFSC